MYAYDVSGQRVLRATVAVRTHDGNLALVFGDEQGSVSVTMPVTVTLNPDGTMASATIADAQAVTRLNSQRVWEALSKTFASRASGQVDGFMSSASFRGPASVYVRVEVPALDDAFSLVEHWLP